MSCILNSILTHATYTDDNMKTLINTLRTAETAIANAFEYGNGSLPYAVIDCTDEKFITDIDIGDGDENAISAVQVIEFGFKNIRAYKNDEFQTLELYENATLSKCGKYLLAPGALESITLDANDTFLYIFKMSNMQ